MEHFQQGLKDCLLSSLPITRIMKTSQASYFLNVTSEQSHERQTPQAENFPSDDVDDKNKHHKEITVKLDSHTNKSSHFKCHQCGKIGFRSP